MCVIATKKTGFALPKKEILEQCFNSNRDGAGFAWNKENTVHWIKGLMTFEAFYAKLKETFPTPESELEASIGMHFRIGTHGPKATESHTHPFPVLVDSLTDTGELSGTNEAVIFHNGVMHSMVNITKEKVKTSDGKLVDPSDSQIFTYYFVRPIWKAFKLGAFDVLDVDNALSTIASGQRIALLDYTGNIAHYGHWIEDKEISGCSFSNTSYELPKPVQSYGLYPSYRGSSWPDEALDDSWWADAKVSNRIIKTRKYSCDAVVQAQRTEPFYDLKTFKLRAFPALIEHYTKLAPKTILRSLDGKIVICYEPSVDGEIYTFSQTTSGMCMLYVKKVDCLPAVVLQPIGSYYLSTEHFHDDSINNNNFSWASRYQKYPVAHKVIEKLDLKSLEAGVMIRKEKYKGGWLSYCPTIDGDVYYYIPSKHRGTAVLYRKIAGAFYVLGRFDLKD